MAAPGAGCGAHAPAHRGTRHSSAAPTNPPRRATCWQTRWPRSSRSVRRSAANEAIPDLDRVAQLTDLVDLLGLVTHPGVPTAAERLAVADARPAARAPAGDEVTRHLQRLESDPQRDDGDPRRAARSLPGGSRSPGPSSPEKIIARMNHAAFSLAPAVVKAGRGSLARPKVRSALTLCTSSCRPSPVPRHEQRLFPFSYLSERTILLYYSERSTERWNVWSALRPTGGPTVVRLSRQERPWVRKRKQPWHGDAVAGRPTRCGGRS